MGDSYDRVRERSTAEAVMQKAHLVVEIVTSWYSKSRIAEMEQKMQWIHVLQNKREFSEAVESRDWVGKLDQYQ